MTVVPSVAVGHVVVGHVAVGQVVSGHCVVMRLVVELSSHGSHVGHVKASVIPVLDSGAEV